MRHLGDGSVEGPTDRPGPGTSRWAKPRPRWPFRAVIIVLIVGLVTTGVLTWVSDELDMRNEKHLLDLRAKDVGALLTSALPTVETPLGSAAALADATRGDRARFRQFIAPYVGSGNARPFVSVSLWRVDNPGRGPVAVVGVRPALTPSMAGASGVFATAAKSPDLTVRGLLQRRRLGYAFTGSGHGPFAAYGESALPANRYVPVQKNSALNDINYALYLGSSTNRAHLLIASVRRLPLSGRHTTVKVPFGNRFFTVTVAARGPLAGSLPEDLPWAIAIVGTLLTLGAGALTMRLIQRRRRLEQLAEQLQETAEENRRLYAEQRTIAQTLQHALLPDRLPQLPGLEVSARYQAGVAGVDVGGDWYDAIPRGEGQLLLIVGDVSGRGLRAATTMASLRFAIRAYVAEGHDPPEVLRRLSGLVSVSLDRQLATVLCVLVDVAQRTVTVTNAGHLPLLVISPEQAAFVDSHVGLPVGVDPEASYSSTMVSVHPGSTLLAFTDGLVERRGESIDVGLERLRSYAGSNHASLDVLLTRVLDELSHDTPDDTAIAAIRWNI
jgi:hypothetical protein